ncbi:hypothetical protein [Hyphomicrobium sp.]|uniref:hypothetical protein n=1 Tax=Hyphomicrobium sp. TaxID=82 RepID=UPI000FB84F86|nr:hypothetical protein [Hyphomicrobium sp.]RUP00605.1 MAG: hypothetical protein EKK30_00650 [Hyphomicrobium sp.]
MKFVLAIAATAVSLAISASPLFAEDQADPTRHTMGDSGKLPASGAVSTRVPDMGAGTGTSTGTDGTSKRMGDEGKLPATNSMSNEVPKMSAPSGTDK